MRHLLISILFFILTTATNEAYSRINSFDTSHFYSIVDKEQFDTLKGTDFTWVIFKPINDTLSHTPF